MRAPFMILVAEDHEASREALRALLEAHGFTVILAANGREAVDIAVAERPDLILMDLMMPELDGFEATRHLRRDARTRRTPIIVVTAMQDSRMRALEAGADECVQKPFEIRKLMARLDDFLAGA